MKYWEFWVFIYSNRVEQSNVPVVGLDLYFVYFCFCVFIFFLVKRIFVRLLVNKIK